MSDDGENYTEEELVEILNTVENEDVKELIEHLSHKIRDSEQIMYGLMILATISGHEGRVVEHEELMQFIDVAENMSKSEHVENVQMVSEVVRKVSRANIDHAEEFAEASLDIIDAWDEYKDGIVEDVEEEDDE